jgi:hypothetical protein
VDPAAPTAEAYDNLRLICADVTQHLGAALAHAQQALEMAELDNPAGSAREWDDADVMQNLRSSASICGSKEHPAISCDLILSHIQSTPSTKSTPSTTSTNP